MQAYTKADQLIHQLAQSITKFNRCYVPEEPDDSHTNLAFDPVANRLVGRWADSSHGAIIIGLDLEGFFFDIRKRDGTQLCQFPIVGNTQTAIEKGLGKNLPAFGLDARNFTGPLHFDTPHYSFAKEPFQLLCPDEITAWARVRSLANDACHWALNHLQVAGEVRIWPHHFDTGMFVELSDNLSVGFGLAMEDPMLNTPYFYYSAYGTNGQQIDYNKFSSLQNGKWVAGPQWKGAVMGALEAVPQQVLAFIREVSTCYLQNH